MGDAVAIYVEWRVEVAPRGPGSPRGWMCNVFERQRIGAGETTVMFGPMPVSVLNEFYRERRSYWKDASDRVLERDE